jgi:hypothetical protein
MSHLRTASFTQADVARALRAREQVAPGKFIVEIAAGGECLAGAGTPQYKRGEKLFSTAEDERNKQGSFSPPGRKE